MKLASENKLAKMNNHVDRTSQNGETISHAEVIAIALLRGRPGLDRLLDEFFARPEVKADVEELQFDETSDIFSVGNFLICSSDPDINPSGEEQAEQVRILFTEPRER